MKSVITLILFAMCASGSCARSQLPSAGETASSGRQAETSSTAGDGDVPSHDDLSNEPDELTVEQMEARYNVPETGLAELQQYVERIGSYDPIDTNDLLVHERRAPAALLQAAQRILALKPDPASTSWRQAHEIVLRDRITHVDSATPDEQRGIFADLSQVLGAKQHAGPLGTEDLVFALRVAERLEDVDPSLAATAYTRFGELFANAEEGEIVEMREMMMGAARRLQLAGHVLQLEGTRMDGSMLRLPQLRGKVVLVAFWATWCAPCVAEHSHMKEVYQSYRGRGFEIVGVSMDTDTAALQRYLRETQIPWITLHETAPVRQNPAIKLYGVMRIPTSFLVDRHAKVVSLAARGEELERLLVKLMGPPAQTAGQ